MRLQIWADLQEVGTEAVAPTQIRSLEIYGGAAGIWADKDRTKSLTPDTQGLAVSVLHTGRSYPDDLSEVALLYHYPDTNRSGLTDANEIASMKWALQLKMPIFAVLPSTAGTAYRSVRLGWVEDYDDAAALFLISFGNEPEGPALPEAEEEPFELKGGSKSKRTSSGKTRPGQQAFAMKVFHRYGSGCAVCTVSYPGLVDAAHLCPVEDDGCNDARNGLPLCALHHRALDRKLWAIDPGTTALACRPQGPTTADLQITRSNLKHLPALPHHDALMFVWRRWQGS
jgi:hypothetical protein